MCGIVGIVELDNNFVDHSNKILGMNQSNFHRGPDAGGIWHSNCRRVSFGHRRLSIIDLTDKALQPIKSYDSKYILTFNGEIYNFKELRKQCEQLNSTFYSLSDSEVIIECYRHFGLQCFKKMRGMWALALYDSEKNKVVLSRDPFAIKPLYYGVLNGTLFFGSEPVNLHQASDYFKSEDLITSDMFLEHGYLERGDWTFYKNIKRFPHAHYLELDLDKNDISFNFKRYWTPDVEINHKITYSDATKRLQQLLVDSVRLHLQSDVPVGACLSGGIDSSAIVAIGTSQMPGKQFSTFTTHYPNNPLIDETKWAKKIIDSFKTKSYFIEPTKESFMRELQKLIVAQGEPFGSMSIFAQYTVFKKISETNVKVVLDGQGSDEMLAGYLGFLPLYFDDLLAKNSYFTYLRECFNFRISGLEQSDTINKLKNNLKLLLKNKHKSTAHSDIILGEYKDELEFRIASLYKHHLSFEERLQDLLCDSNIPQLLRYEDRNSMCFSIESRIPFLESELVNFILSLPANYRIRKGFTKAILRDALKGIIPEDIRLRRDKLGFPAPELQWLAECFDIQADVTGGRQWRDFIYSKWSTLNYTKKYGEECA